jgi:ribosomal protein S18 acetylase RimI-like enzyme
LPAREDVWLAGVLERPTFAVEPPYAPPDKTGFYYGKVPVEDVKAVSELIGYGFSVVDVNVTFAHAGVAAGSHASAVVGPARPEHHEALVEIAGRCFRYSRFHLDPEIPNALADRVKREWLRSYSEGRRGLELLAAVDDDQPVGFLAVLETGGQRVIDLVGVAPETQGRGVGQALVAAFVTRHGGHGADLIVGTQLANIPSLRLYQSQGFEISRAAYVLHLHHGR